MDQKLDLQQFVGYLFLEFLVLFAVVSLFFVKLFCIFGFSTAFSTFESIQKIFFFGN